jgi:hypothetical protein
VNAVADLRPGATVELEVIGLGRTRTVSVRLARAPSAQR